MPEVEAIAAYAGERAVGRRIARADLAAISVLKTFDPPLHAVEGAHVTGVGRRGKFLVVSTDAEPGGVHLVVHLARAGWLQWRDELPAGPPKPGKGPLALRVGLVTDDGEPAGGFDVTEAGTRKSVALSVVRDPREVPGVARLGPEPLDPAFDVDALQRVLSDAGGKQLKGVLRDQATIAGIGNAYSDEILHVARLSPFAAAGRLGPDDVARLHEAMTTTLRDAIDRSVGQGTGALKGEKRAGMRVHGRTGEACPVCGDVVREVAFADSSLQYCATCQTGGQPLADRRMSRLLK